jgi:hypothetical protein
MQPWFVVNTAAARADLLFSSCQDSASFTGQVITAASYL